LTSKPGINLAAAWAYARPWQEHQSAGMGSRAELLNSPAIRMSLVDVIGKKGDFVAWLGRNRLKWLKMLALTRNVDSGEIIFAAKPDWPVWESVAILRWFHFNQVKLEVGEYASIYFPRHVYGEYLDDLATGLFNGHGQDDISISHVHGKVGQFSTANPSHGPHNVKVDVVGGEQLSITADYFIYAAGDLPPRPITSCQSETPSAAIAKIVQDPYGAASPRHARHMLVRDAIANCGSEPVNLVIAGCNASAMEQIWAMANDSDIMSALNAGHIRITLVSPGELPHSGAILVPADNQNPVNAVREILPMQIKLIDAIIDSNFNSKPGLGARQYFAAVKRSIQQLELHRQPHIFMTFLRKLGEIEQGIKDGFFALPNNPDEVSELQQFARQYHARIEAMLLFTPFEYWQVLGEILEIEGALQKIDGRVEGFEPNGAGLSVRLSTGGSDKLIDCALLINCTGAQDPFSCIATNSQSVLSDLIAAGLGQKNHVGGLATAADGRLLMADGAYSETAYLCSQRTIATRDIPGSDRQTFISANRLTAVRVAELAATIAKSITERL